MNTEYFDNDKIIICDYEVLACHGVNPEEKTNAQRFLISAEIFSDFSRACVSDNVEDTISYSAVCKLIKAYVKDNCFNLLEKLADSLAREILRSFDSVEKLIVTVKKPDAPMKGIFDYVGVRIERGWHKVYIALGSNIGDREAYLDAAALSLKKDGNIKNFVESDRMKTKPYGGVADAEFLNGAAEFLTLYSPIQLLNVLNGIEAENNRKREARWGNRTLDLDILFYDDEIINSKSLTIPHADMQNRDFVLKPLSELCPNYIHPVYKKSVSELYRSLLNGKTF